MHLNLSSILKLTLEDRERQNKMLLLAAFLLQISELSHENETI